MALPDAELVATGTTPKSLWYLHLEGPQIEIPRALHVWAENGKPVVNTYRDPPFSGICSLNPTQPLTEPKVILHAESSGTD